MRLNDSILIRVVPALLLALALGPDIARAQGVSPNARAIEFSSPKNGGSNLFNQFHIGDDGTALPDDSFHAPPSILPVRSLDGVGPMRSAQPSAAQSKRMKAELERQKNWVFGDPDEKLRGTTAEDIFHLKELDASGDPVETQSTVVKYLERQAAKAKATDKAKVDSQQKESANTISGIRRLMDTSNAGLNSALTPGVPDVFVPQSGFGYSSRAVGASDYNPKPTATGIAQKSSMEEFNRTIGMTEADSLQKSPLTSSLNSDSPNSVGADWNPFLSSAKPALPKKIAPSTTSLSPIDSPIGVAATKTPTPVVVPPPKTPVEGQFNYQPLFSPDFSMPRRRVQ